MREFLGHVTERVLRASVAKRKQRRYTEQTGNLAESAGAGLGGRLASAPIAASGLHAAVIGRRLPNRRMLWAMKYKKHAAVILAGSFIANTGLEAYCNLQLFTDLPPMSAVAAASASSFSGTMYVPFYSTTTDELIEAPAPQPVRITQS